jgi:hypothetical protein
VLYRGILALAARRHRDGVSKADLIPLARRLRAAMSAPRHESRSCVLAEACCDRQDGEPIDVAEAARILGLSPRQVQRLAAQGLGKLLGRLIWALDRQAEVAP